MGVLLGLIVPNRNVQLWHTLGPATQTDEYPVKCPDIPGNLSSSHHKYTNWGEDRGDRREERAERRSSKLEPRTTVLIPLTFPLPLALNLDGLLYQLDQRRFSFLVWKKVKQITRQGNGRHMHPFFQLSKFGNIGHQLEEVLLYFSLIGFWVSTAILEQDFVNVNK